MTGPPPDRSSLTLATGRLRELALSQADGVLLGSEDAVVRELAVSRATLKQAARSLEREGLIRVKRGVSGGYYSARPTEHTLKTIVSAYLDTIDVALDDVVSVTTILWLEVVRRACTSADPGLGEALMPLLDDLGQLGPQAPFGELDTIEQASRRAIFRFVDCRYIELIMRINQAFGGRSVAPLRDVDDLVRHREFVSAWRKAKTIELQAIIDHDARLGDVAARNAREAWNRQFVPSGEPIR